MRSASHTVWVHVYVWYFVRQSLMSLASAFEAGVESYGSTYLVAPRIGVLMVRSDARTDASDRRMRSYFTNPKRPRSSELYSSRMNRPQLDVPVRPNSMFICMSRVSGSARVLRVTAWCGASTTQITSSPMWTIWVDVDARSAVKSTWRPCSSFTGACWLPSASVVLYVTSVT